MASLLKHFDYGDDIYFYSFPPVMDLDQTPLDPGKEACRVRLKINAKKTRLSV